MSLSTSRHITTMTARDSQTFALPDGRVLGYAEYGLPNGYPVFYFHGFPTSRLEARGTDAIARRKGLRIIAVDRPGFGLSTFQPQRRIIDWPDDIQACAHHLQLSKFVVFGASGGGPYALACAHAIPQETLSGVGLFASGPPWVAGRQYMSRARRMLATAVTYWPSAVRVVTNVVVGMARWVANTGPVARRVDAWIESLDKKKDVKEEDEVEEDEPLTIAQRRERLYRMGFEGFAQGARGFVHETQLLVADDWGFKFEDVTYDKVHIWHGAKDTFAPARMIRYMAERLPHCEYKEYENDSHVTLGDHLEEALSELVPEELSAKHETVRHRNTAVST